MRLKKLSSSWDGLVNDLNKTEIPHYALSKKLPADSYFTSKNTAEKCLSIFLQKMKEEKVNIEDYTFIEPSTGDGCFFDLLPIDKRIGVDIIDRRDDVITADFLTWKPESLQSKYLTVGNPPFGVRGALALAFVNRSLLFSEYVGFILPMSFHSNGKGTNMKRVLNGHLIHSQILEGETFFSPDNNKEIKVNTLFQVWKRGAGKGIFLDYDISEYVDIYTVCSSHDRLCGLDKIDMGERKKLVKSLRKIFEEAKLPKEEIDKKMKMVEEEPREKRCYDFYVSGGYFGNTLSTVYKFEDLNYGSGYGVIIKKNKTDIMSLIKDVEWNNYSSLATNNCKHIRTHLIEECLFNFGFGKVKQSKNLEKFFI